MPCPLQQEDLASCELAQPIVLGLGSIILQKAADRLFNDQILQIFNWICLYKFHITIAKGKTSHFYTLLFQSQQTLQQSWNWQIDDEFVCFLVFVSTLELYWFCRLSAEGNWLRGLRMMHQQGNTLSTCIISSHSSFKEQRTKSYTID